MDSAARQLIAGTCTCIGRRYAAGVHTCDPDRNRDHAAVAVMFMTYMSLGVLVDVKTNTIIDMIRPMTRIPSNHLCYNVELGNSNLYQHLATRRRFLSKDVPAYRMATSTNLGKILMKSGWKPH